MSQEQDTSPTLWNSGNSLVAQILNWFENSEDQVNVSYCIFIIIEHSITLTPLYTTSQGPGFPGPLDMWSDSWTVIQTVQGHPGLPVDISGCPGP